MENKESLCFLVEKKLESRRRNDSGTFREPWSKRRMEGEGKMDMAVRMKKEEKFLDKLEKMSELK